MNKDLIENILENRFDMSQWELGFVDHFSDMCTSIGNNTLELKELSPRGLVEKRNPLTEKLCQVEICADPSKNRYYPIYVTKTRTLPWVVEQEGQLIQGNEDALSVNAILCSPSKNALIWKIDLKHHGKFPSEFKVRLSGKLTSPENQHHLCIKDNSVISYYRTGTKKTRYKSQIDRIQPVWAIKTSWEANIYIDEDNCEYMIYLKPEVFENDLVKTLTVQLNYDLVEEENLEGWSPENSFLELDIKRLLNERKKWWTDSLERIDVNNGDSVKTLRSAAGLIRTGNHWRGQDGKDDIIASYCSITNWASTAFFWDSLVSSVGLSFFNPDLSKDAVRALYTKQREDGCVPTCSYSHIEGSTFYPQAPITAWSLVHMLINGAADVGFLREILPKIKLLYKWFTDTQDHDRDGLPEWRFTGCPADNSPLYDHYAGFINKDLSEQWNIYLPPIASVSLASYLIMEAKCLAYLNDSIGQIDEKQYFLHEAIRLEGLLKEICLCNEELFFDYDHHNGRFNNILTLHSFLPIWAGVEIQDSLKKNMIEKYLLNEDHFYGECPFPYLAYSEEAYKPDGYWRGRIWPHTTLWMLELLWENGYHKEADIAADKLLNMMNQSEQILENYYSHPQMHGGGEPDYNWSLASYIYLENRAYRRRPFF